MSKAKESHSAKVDAIMEKASRALVERRYFEAERLSAEALEEAHGAGDYERMSRILMPLQEARRQKRQLAGEANGFFVIDDQLPKPGKLVAGCYLVKPPRVGLDARMLREMADRREVPVIIVCREPTTREGKWPVVALGPVTVRAKVDPPTAAAPKKRGRKPVTDADQEPLPDLRWFLEANERLGDAAIEGVDAARGLANRIEDLFNRLNAHPDHEKLHQRLADLCAEAARQGLAGRRERSDALAEFDEEHVEGDDEAID